MFDAIEGGRYWGASLPKARAFAFNTRVHRHSTRSAPLSCIVVYFCAVALCTCTDHHALRFSSARCFCSQLVSSTPNLHDDKHTLKGLRTIITCMRSFMNMTRICIHMGEIEFQRICIHIHIFVKTSIRTE